jgi:membrane protein insertase Oxa1/YidC/SpoIIIJ
VYWVTSNILSFLQSYIIYKRMGIDIPLEEWIKRKLGKSKALPEGMDVIDPGQK